jgi:tripartite-type tricarboxylate transporter receptor subunit TctC
MQSIFATRMVFIWLGFLAALNCAFAASYPSRPVRILVVSLPGSPNDVTSRVVGNHLTELWGQQFIVDNRSGAGGQIAMELAAKASPDGYTMVNSGDGPMAISPAIKRHLPYDPLKDFEPMAFTAFTDYILVVIPSLPVHSVSDLVALAKSKPGTLRYGSAGVGFTNHLGMELFKLKAGIDLVHVPYKGGPAVVADLLAGQIELAMVGPPSIPHIKAGKLRAIAVPGAKRTELMPDLPTIAETIPGVDVRTWGAFFAPAGTPKAILDKLHQEITRRLNQPETKKLLASQGLSVEAMTRGELRDLVKTDIKKYTDLVKTLKMPLLE